MMATLRGLRGRRGRLPTAFQLSSRHSRSPIGQAMPSSDGKVAASRAARRAKRNEKIDALSPILALISLPITLGADFICLPFRSQKKRQYLASQRAINVVSASMDAVGVGMLRAAADMGAWALDGICRAFEPLIINQGGDLIADIADDPDGYDLGKGLTLRIDRSPYSSTRV